LFGDKKTFFLALPSLVFCSVAVALARLNRLRRQRQMPIRKTSAMANFGRLLRPMWTIKRSGRNTNHRSRTARTRKRIERFRSEPA
jgi:hypothetical protein